jgi:membrane protein implicated in regulation of membrane protease activity
MWVLVGFVLTLIELTTPGGFYFLFFGVSALVVGMLTGLGIVSDATVEWLLFSVTSILALLFFRRPLLKKFHSDTTPVEVDSLVGETALVLDDIPASGFGKVELRGTAWNARNGGSASLSRGQRCTVERVEGLSLWVRPQ